MLINHKFILSFFVLLYVSSSPSLIPGIVAEQFLNSTATQLTYHGLCELTSTVQEGELCVFFRNNHFSTMIKYKVNTVTSSFASFASVRSKVACHGVHCGFCSNLNRSHVFRTGPPVSDKCPEALYFNRNKLLCFV